MFGNPSRTIYAVRRPVSAPPYMQVYVAEYTADVQHLSCEQDGAYWRLLRAMWRAGGALPSDDRKLANIVGLSLVRWIKISPDVMSLFQVGERVVTHKRIALELEKVSLTSTKRSDAGKRGAEVKALKNNDTPQANAKAGLEAGQKPALSISDIRSKTVDKEDSPPLPTVEASPKGGAVVVLKGAGKPPADKRGSRVPITFQPTPEERDFARRLDFSDQEIDDETEAFVDYWRGVPGQKGLKLDWSATWKNRFRELKRRREERGQRFGAAGGVGSPRDREHQRRGDDLRAGIVEAVVRKRGS